MSDNATPADGNALFRELSKFVLTPITLRRMFLLLTRIHYSSSDNYGEFKSLLVDYIWNRDTKLCKLFVDFDYNFDPQNMDRRPAIYVGLDDINFQKAVVDDHVKHSYDRSTEEFIKYGHTNVIVRHIGKTADESLLLSDLSSEFFMGIKSMIHDSFPRITSYDVQAIKSSRPFAMTSQEASAQFISDLIISISFNAMWQIEFESHRIKTITLEQCLAEMPTKV